MSAWVKQIASQVEKHGASKASWYCEWDEPTGGRRCKSCGPGIRGKRVAEQMAEQVNAEIVTGRYNQRKDVGWSEFRKRYEDSVTTGFATEASQAVGYSLDAFERILRLKTKTVSYVTAERLAEFTAERRKDRGVKRGSTVSPATINKDLRHVKAALNVAVEWGYLDKLPKIRFEHEPKNLPRYITPEHFAAIYKACDVATWPTEMHVAPVDWWRGLLMFLQMTGWRISETLSLEWSDVDLLAGTATTRAVDNKSKRDDVVALHPIVVEHLQPLKTFHANVFPWEHGERQLYEQFGAIQTAAGIKLPCRIDREHECTDACHRYSFHDERRSFATMNAANMSRETLQALMRHQSGLTTERYINFARQMKPAVANLHVPDVPSVCGRTA